MRPAPAEVQRAVTRLALALAGQFRFALAGSGALREHGLTERPTEDIDLFTTDIPADEFGAAVEQVGQGLRASGYSVDERHRAGLFARLRVSAGDGMQFDLDLGVDWRAHEPVHSSVGPLLDLADAVGNKVSALYGRGEARDYLDVDAIRSSGRFSDEQLLAAAAERDPGFERDRFAQQLEAARRLQPAQVARYGVTAEELQAVQHRCADWAAVIRAAE